MRLMHQAHARELAALDAQFRSGAYQKQYAAAVAQKSQLEEQLAALTPLLEQYAAVDAAHAATQVVQVSPRVSVCTGGSIASSGPASSHTALSGSEVQTGSNASLPAQHYAQPSQLYPCHLTGFLFARLQLHPGGGGGGVVRR